MKKSSYEKAPTRSQTLEGASSSVGDAALDVVCYYSRKEVKSTNQGISNLYEEVKINIRVPIQPNSTLTNWIEVQ